LPISNTDNKIAAQEEAYLYTQASQIPDAGLGLFTAIPIYKGETIALFKGDILDAAEAKKRAADRQDQYFIMLLDGKIMDSKNTACFAKYANDAKGSPDLNFKNNAKITLNDNDQVCIQATKKIKAENEIFVAYGKRYWKKHLSKSI